MKEWERPVEKKIRVCFVRVGKREVDFLSLLIPPDHYSISIHQKFTLFVVSFVTEWTCIHESCQYMYVPVPKLETTNKQPRNI